MKTHPSQQPATSRSHGTLVAFTLAIAALGVSACDSGDQPEGEDLEASVADELHGADALKANVDVERLGDLENDIFEIDSSPDDDEELQVGRKPPVLARVERRSSSVEWRAAGDVVVLMISGTAEDAPLLDMDTAEALTPVQAWVAIADEPTNVPRALLERATSADLALLEDAAQIDSLRADVQHKLAVVSEIQAQPLEPHDYGTCTAGQINTARTVYGQGYTSASTCGDNVGFDSTERDYWYCNSGSGCDFELASEETSCIPAVNNNAAVIGTLDAVTMRSKGNGNPTFITGGHRIRSLTYNCHGDNTLNVYMEYGTSTWDEILASGYYVGVVALGSDHLPERAYARDYVSYAGWDNGIPASGATYKTTEYSVTGNAAAGDFSIFCTDAQKSLTMSEGPTGNAYDWCTGACSVGNCWD